MNLEALLIAAFTPLILLMIAKPKFTGTLVKKERFTI